MIKYQKITLLDNMVFIAFVRNPPRYTQRRLGIQSSVTSGPTSIALLAVCCRVLLRYANSLPNLGDTIIL